MHCSGERERAQKHRNVNCIWQLHIHTYVSLAHAHYRATCNFDSAPTDRMQYNSNLKLKPLPLRKLIFFDGSNFFRKFSLIFGSCPVLFCFTFIQIGMEKKLKRRNIEKLDRSTVRIKSSYAN